LRDDLPSISVLFMSSLTLVNLASHNTRRRGKALLSALVAALVE
jgi:hypothetical protein